MSLRDPVLFRQLPVIQKIIQDETWLAGERRGCHVAPDDREVRDRVCEIVLRIGQQLRDAFSGASGAEVGFSPAERSASDTTPGRTSGGVVESETIDYVI